MIKIAHVWTEEDKDGKECEKFDDTMEAIFCDRCKGTDIEA
jgi:hypothetical protein